MERKPLAIYFKEDNKLWKESFSFGKFYVISEKMEKGYYRGLKLVRVRRKKEKSFIDWKDVVYMSDKGDPKLYPGDLLFMSNGDNEGIKQHFEVVGNLVGKVPHELSKKEVLKKLKKHPSF